MSGYEEKTVARSLKKGPFIEGKLLERVAAMNRSSEKRIIRTWSRRSVTRTFRGHSGHTKRVLSLK
jgi:ribosomal protein S19